MQISFIILYLQHGRHGKHSIDTQAFVFGSKMPFYFVLYHCSLSTLHLYLSVVLRS